MVHTRAVERDTSAPKGHRPKRQHPQGPRGPALPAVSSAPLSLPVAAGLTLQQAEADGLAICGGHLDTSVCRAERRLLLLGAELACLERRQRRRLRQWVVGWGSQGAAVGRAGDARHTRPRALRMPCREAGGLASIFMLSLTMPSSPAIRFRLRNPWRSSKVKSLTRISGRRPRRLDT